LWTFRASDPFSSFSARRASSPCFAHYALKPDFALLSRCSGSARFAFFTTQSYLAFFPFPAFGARFTGRTARAFRTRRPFSTPRPRRPNRTFPAFAARFSSRASSAFGTSHAGFTLDAGRS
jgi:hypothetical protein